MTLKKYYTAIFIPLILIISATLYFNESSIILLIFCYYIYRCILDYYVLKSRGIVTYKDAWKFIVPIWSIIYFKELYFKQ